MLPKKRQPVPVTTLETNTTVHNSKEATPAQTEWITPLEDRPLSVLEQVFDYARHVGRSEFALEHVPYGRSAVYGLADYLVVCRILGVKVHEGIDIAPIKRAHPGVDYFFWSSHFHSPPNETALELSAPTARGLSALVVRRSK